MSAVRIVVVGVGLVSPLAGDAPGTFTRLLRGDRGFRPPTLFDPSALKARLAGEASIERVDRPGWSRTAGMATLAAREATRGCARMIVNSDRGDVFQTRSTSTPPPASSSSSSSVVQPMRRNTGSTARCSRATQGIVLRKWLITVIVPLTRQTRRISASMRRASGTTLTTWKAIT